MKFTLLRRDVAGYLTDRYSERKESAATLGSRVNLIPSGECHASSHCWGSDAGISAALRARELDPAAEVHMVVADAHPNFSICGLPFYLSGEISDWRTLAHRSREVIEAAGIRLHLDEEATGIDVSARLVATRTADGVVRQHAYDRLVIATGRVGMVTLF